MLANYEALSGPRQLLTWIVLVSIVVGLVSVYDISRNHRRPSASDCLIFRTAWLTVFFQIGFRLLSGARPGTIGYGSVLIYALPGLACAWSLIDSIQNKGAKR